MVEITTLDLGFMGIPRLVASYLVECGDGGFALIETGPARALGRLRRAVARAGYRLADLRAVLLTHIHLDHAGAAGALARSTGATVYVHPAGAPHLADPGAKLIPSARKLYGWRLRWVWGVMRGVPVDRLVPVDHGSTVGLGTIDVTAWHTPGHARHHIAWQLEGVVATGDVAGVRLPGCGHVLPPTPPPDIDFASWYESIGLIRGLNPTGLLLTHYGAVTDVTWHLDQLEERLDRWGGLARAVAAEGGSRDRLAASLTELDDSELTAAQVARPLAQAYRRLCPMTDNAAGLLRHVSRAGSDRGDGPPLVVDGVSELKIEN